MGNRRLQPGRSSPAYRSAGRPPHAARRGRSNSGCRRSCACARWRGPPCRCARREPKGGRTVR
ncbi:hypothetical protein F6X38_22870 [Aureimonas leprariae]|uniref:Uncharacterized protein n=1 Tax=Plantimonas leprariae TaxID=2615207 RepID=A0A7V7TUK1_9HYPH|nr:hypothetical protein F6X38_22870 [Aureimonas leprariae]